MGKLYYKSLFENVRFPVGKINEDEYTTYKILFSFEKIVFVSDKLYMYFQNIESIMGARWTNRRLDIFAAFEQQLSYFNEKGFNRVWKDTARIYLSDMGYAIKQLEQLYPSSKLIKTYRKKLRVSLRRYGKKIEWSMKRKSQIYVYSQF